MILTTTQAQAFNAAMTALHSIGGRLELASTPDQAVLIEESARGEITVTDCEVGAVEIFINQADFAQAHGL